ncbi:MAG: aminopeptidase P family protein [Dysgonamonadaceae bacterium]|jgi:Xaa-Pro aminopeptidase|nr:aminopeptidase P family protein [Dysgonamonadaceae bacterium]
MKSREKIQLLREAMKNENVQACIIPKTDPHIGEYIPSHWKTLEWISGFNGSAGTMAITMEKAGLWTDSRYFIQAEQQLKNSGIDLYKTGISGTPSIEEWIKNQLSINDTVGLEGKIYSASDALSLIRFFNKHRINVKSDFAPCDFLWKDRPSIPSNKAFIFPEEFSGESTQSKINRLLTEMKKQNCNYTVLASLDMIAWLFNLRGNDIDYNPVVVSYAVVSEKEQVLFINPRKLSEEVAEHLQNQKVILADYDKIESYITHIPTGSTILITPNKINHKLYSGIPTGCRIVQTDVHPIDYMKSIKNEKEIEGFRNAMRRDGVALVKFLIRIENQLKNNQTVTELSVGSMLKELRSEQQYFVGESFETIAGYGEHGAIVHYGATPETDATILSEGLLLIDSGAQYFDGTTDITRTISVGNVSDEMKKDFTNVLKGNIRLSKAVFPRGTVGMQLDVLARQFIWEEGQNFLHGTGHGIGHFLNVHEGPQSIRMNYNPTALQPGMITSNEPGLYKSGKYGIRIENLMLTIPCKTTEFGEFYAFEILTLCPIDRKMIDWSLITEEEKEWLENYHLTVYEQLSPFLTEEEKEWLKNQ